MGWQVRQRNPLRKGERLDPGIQPVKLQRLDVVPPFLAGWQIMTLGDELFRPPEDLFMGQDAVGDPILEDDGLSLKTVVDSLLLGAPDEEPGGERPDQGKRQSNPRKDRAREKKAPAQPTGF